MTLDEIIAEINEKYHNALDNTSKVRKMNILQKRLYRKLRKQTLQSFSLVSGTAEYPITVNIDDIYDVLVGNSVSNQYTSYPLRKITDTAWGSSNSSCGRWHYFLGDVDTGDYIGIHPTPTDNEDTLVIFYYEEPPELSADNLGVTPPLDSDYHMLFVYHVCKELAENYRDYDIANGFIAQFNDLEREMMSTFQDPEVITVHSESGW